MAQHHFQDAGFLNKAGEEDTVPCHVAIIMDGNRRWAEARGLPVFEGHRQGVEAVRRAVKAARSIGVQFLSLYSFSTENWTRPENEVNHLMNLLRFFIRSDLNKLHKENVKIRIIGDRQYLDADIVELFALAESKTAANTGLTLIVAFNYGSRQEIVRAVRLLAEKLAEGALQQDDITVDALGAMLDTSGIPDPDLLIRTSGEQRLSNFLLWQLAYAEFIFLPILWPEFQSEHFVAAVEEFNQRERRYGGRKALA